MSERESGRPRHVVVGLDNHGHPIGSLAVAADEALRRGTDLAVITVLHRTADPRLDLLGLRREHQLAEATALQSLHEATVPLRSSHPRLSVTTFCLVEDEVQADREPMLDAELLVIGTQDQYGRQALVLGSVSWLLLSSSRCPILVVPDGPPVRHGAPDQPPLVVVGVSEHPSDAAAVRAAYRESLGLGGEVLLLHAYALRPGETPDQARERAGTVVADLAAEAPAGIRVSVAVAAEEPAPALLRLAANATLLVIGSRTGALSGLVRGSVSRALLETVPCPILAVPRNLTAGQHGPIVTG